MDAITLIGAILALAAVYVLLPIAAGAYRRFRGKRIVTCPETGRPAAVELDAARAAGRSLFGEPDPRVARCSRWPERHDCDQACLEAIERSPEAGSIETLVAEWYSGRSCALCGKPIAGIGTRLNRPALRGADHVTHEWCDVPAEDLPRALRESEPVCWNCHIAETFRRLHPEDVTEAPPARRS